MIEKINHDLTPDDHITINKLFDQMPMSKGMIRTVERCAVCHEFFGRQYIPFGLGRGRSLNLCMCQLVGRTMSAIVARREP